MTRTVLLGIAAVVAGCSGTEPRRLSLVDNPRILAITASPAVIGPGETAVLDALVVDRLGPVVDARVSWRACAPWRIVLDPAEQCGPGDSLPLPNAALPAPPGADQVLEIPIIAEADTGDGPPLVAVKRVRFEPEAEQPPLQLSVSALRLDGTEPAMITPGREYTVDVELRASMSPDAEPIDVDINLYATAGEFEDGSLEVEVDAAGMVEPVQTRWLAPADAVDVTFWVVATGPSHVTTWFELEVRR